MCKYTNIYNILLKCTHGVLLNHVYGFRKKGSYTYWEPLLPSTNKFLDSTLLFLCLVKQYYNPKGNDGGQGAWPDGHGGKSRWSHQIPFQTPPRNHSEAVRFCSLDPCGSWWDLEISTCIYTEKEIRYSTNSQLCAKHLKRSRRICATVNRKWHLLQHRAAARSRCKVTWSCVTFGWYILSVQTAGYHVHLWLGTCVRVNSQCWYSFQCLISLMNPGVPLLAAWQGQRCTWNPPRLRRCSS